MSKKQKRISGPKRKQQKRKRGRPTKYSKALADRIINLILEGNSLVKLSAREDMPTRQTFDNWKKGHPDFFGRVKRARETAWEYRLDSCIDTIDVGEMNPKYEPNRITAVVNARINLAKAMSLRSMKIV